MPSIGFVLPHWLYWLGLLFFPLVAMYCVARQKRRPPCYRRALAMDEGAGSKPMLDGRTSGAG